jgi:putative heme-binding domain-containing protein
MPRVVAIRHLSPVFLFMLLLQLQPTIATEPPQPRAPWTTSHLRGTPTSPEPFRIEPAFPQLKFDHPTSLQQIPGTNRLLVAEIGGRVFTFSKDAVTDQADVAVDLQKLANGNVSLFAAVLHPQFQKNRFVYFCLVHPEGGSHTRVSRFTMTNDAIPVIDAKSETVIIKWPSGGHNAGCLRFGNDSLLYIATGDGAGPNPPDGLTTGQDVSDLLGAVLRIDVDHPMAGQNYSIPPDNPFVKTPNARPEIFGYGLRNPWKFGIDSKTNEVFVADNGWETWEMIHLVGSGTNCGWPIMEGRARLRTEVAQGPTPITPPIRDHHHSEANSVIGGPVYRGEKLPTLDGQFVYGDYITGTIWSVGRAADGSFIGRTLVDTDLRITDFMESTTGELYVVDYDLTGQIYELLPNDVEDLSASFPKLLSQTGVFNSLTPLEPAAGIVGYDVVVPRWTDGAVAQRFVGVPGSDRLELAPNSSVRGVYPEGTTFVKHLSIPDASGKATQPLETQVLHLQHGVWNPYSYLWNDAGTDAELVSSIGTSKVVQWPDTTVDAHTTERTWHSGAVNECRLCHNAGPGFVLGFVGNQLAKKTASGADQLESLLSQQVIRSIPDDAKSPAWKLVDTRDESQDLNDRARSYLHGNCSMCHHKGGNAIVSFFLTRDLPFDQMNTDKGTGIGTFGMPNAKIIAAGDPYRSVMMYRMSKLGYARMPYIGSNVVDGHGVSLIEKWVRSLQNNPGSQSERSSLLVAGSPEATALTLLGAARVEAAVRTEAIQTLVGSSPGALALMARLHANALPASDRQIAVESVRNASSDIRGLFDDFIPESQRKKSLGRTFEPSLVLKHAGDALRGRLIFYSDAARCRNCHHHDDATLSVGPTLAEISRKYVHNSELLQHVVTPSQKIDDKYAAWIAVTVDGRILNGLMETQTDDQVVLKTADRKQVTISKSEIEELRKSTTSLMPDGVLSDLTAVEAADLLAFIRSITEAAATPKSQR